MNLEPLAYAAEDVAKLLGISRSAVYEELKSGRLAGSKMGGRTLVTAANVKAWLDALPKWEPAIKRGAAEQTLPDAGN